MNSTDQRKEGGAGGNRRVDQRSDGRTDGRTNERTESSINGKINGQTGGGERTHGTIYDKRKKQ